MSPLPVGELLQAVESAKRRVESDALQEAPRVASEKEESLWPEGPSGVVVTPSMPALLPRSILISSPSMDMRGWARVKKGAPSPLSAAQALSPRVFKRRWEAREGGACSAPREVEGGLPP